MAANPYRLDEPFVVSFSGGRTSGYMLWQILQAFGGRIPEGGKVVFCNTGKERLETLDFVERCSQRWGVEVTWLEYRRWATPPEISPTLWHSKVQAGKPSSGLEVVDYATASRKGEPFDQIVSAKPVLPNVAMRYCTEWLKVKTSNRYVRHILGWTAYTNAIGLRADEPRRVARLRASSSPTPGEEPLAPLARAGATLEDVTAFWAVQPFDLSLRPDEGNCDLCFLKGQAKLAKIMRERPDLAAWWIEKEQRFVGKTRLFEAGRFRKDAPSYAQTLKQVQEQPHFDWGDNCVEECRCTD